MWNDFSLSNNLLLRFLTNVLLYHFAIFDIHLDAFVIFGPKTPDPSGLMVSISSPVGEIPSLRHSWILRVASCLSLEKTVWGC